MTAASPDGFDAPTDKPHKCNWKDADPDIPILKEAKAEYAKLH